MIYFYIENMEIKFFFLKRNSSTVIYFIIFYQEYFSFVAALINLLPHEWRNVSAHVTDCHYICQKIRSRAFIATVAESWRSVAGRLLIGLCYHDAH